MPVAPKYVETRRVRPTRSINEQGGGAHDANAFQCTSGGTSGGGGDLGAGGADGADDDDDDDDDGDDDGEGVAMEEIGNDGTVARSGSDSSSFSFSHVSRRFSSLNGTHVTFPSCRGPFRFMARRDRSDLVQRAIGRGN